MATTRRKSSAAPRRKGKLPTIESLTSESEDDVHFHTVALLTMAGYEDEFFHVPNGELRSKRTGARLKRMGVKRGILDFFLGPAKPGLPPAVLEVKKPGEKPTPEQRAWLDRFASWGFRTAWADSKAAVEEQLQTWGYLDRLQRTTT